MGRGSKRLVDKPCITISTRYYGQSDITKGICLNVHENVSFEHVRSLIAEMSDMMSTVLNLIVNIKYSLL